MTETKWRYEIIQGADLEGVEFPPAPKTIEELESIIVEVKEMQSNDTCRRCSQ